VGRSAAGDTGLGPGQHSPGGSEFQPAYRPRPGTFPRAGPGDPGDRSPGPAAR